MPALAVREMTWKSSAVKPPKLMPRGAGGGKAENGELAERGADGGKAGGAPSGQGSKALKHTLFFVKTSLQFSFVCL